MSFKVNLAWIGIMVLCLLDAQMTQNNWWYAVAIFCLFMAFYRNDTPFGV